MKLFIVLSVIACGYAAKLDRTYLPPSSAATAGGSPGALTAPFGSPASGPNQVPGQASFGPSGSGIFPQGQSSGAGQASFGPGPGRFSQPTPSSGLAGPSNQRPSFTPLQSGSSNVGPTSQANVASRPSNQYGAPSSGFPTGTDGLSSAPGFESSPNGSPAKPERPQAAADRNAEILRYQNENDGNTFAYSFETSNGISAEESGVATNGVQAQGGFSYTGDDGEVYKVTYTADENGYQPQGDHLPTPPPIPDEILRSLEENARAAAAGTQEGAYQPDEDISGSPQQYSGSSPSQNQPQGSAQSYNQPQGPAQTYNQPQGPTQSYNQPQGSAQSYNRPQGPAQTYNQPQGPAQTYNQPQGPAQTYNQPQGPAQTYNQPQGPTQSYNQPQGPTQSYNRPQGPAQSYNRPQGSAQSYNQPQGSAQGPSQQYGTPNTGSSLTGTNPAQSGPRNQLSGSSAPSSPQGSAQFGAPTPSGRGSSTSSQQFQNNAATNGPARQFPTPSQTLQGNDNGYQYNRPQGPAGSFPASRQDQSSSQSRPSQQYNAPTTSGSGSSQRPTQQYGAPAVNGGSNQVSQQYGAPIAPGRGSSQSPKGSQYNAPSAPNTGRGSSQGPSQQYGAPSTSSRGSVQAPQYNAPVSSSSNTNAPSQQYGTPSTSGRGSVQAPQYNAPSSPSRDSNAPSQQYGAPSTGSGRQRPQFGSPNAAAPTGNTGITGPFSRQDQTSAQNRPQSTFGQVQAQNENGYQYGRPQGTPFGQGPSVNIPQSGNQPAPQYNQPAQSSFARPGSPSSQTPSGFGTGPTTGPAAALVSQSLLPGSRGNGATPATPAGSRPTQSSFGSTPGQYRPGQAMTDATQYNQSGAPSGQGSQPSQSSFRPAVPTFGGPRQPPSFSPETGYVY